MSLVNGIDNYECLRYSVVTAPDWQRGVCISERQALVRGEGSERGEEEKRGRASLCLALFSPFPSRKPRAAIKRLDPGICSATFIGK